MRTHVQKNFSAAAARYDKHATLQHSWMRQALDALREHLAKPDAHIADIGCGTGLLAEAARAAMPAWRITGIDHAPGMIALAKERCDAVHLADACALPLPDASLDAVVSSLCLQWVEDKDQAFAEMLRVLKPGGVAVVMTLVEGTLHELKQAVEAVGYPLHLLPMDTVEAYHDAAGDFAILSSSAEETVQPYASLAALVQSMRAIGAAGVLEPRPKPRGAQGFRSLQEYYTAHYGTQATWRSLLLVLKKPEAA